MSVSLAVIEAIKDWISGLDSLWIWSGVILALLYAIFDTKDTLDEIKEAVGKKRKLLCLKLTLLWVIPMLGLIAAYAGKLSSDKSEATIKLLENRSRPRRITPEQADKLRCGLPAIVRNRVIKIFIQDADAEGICQTD
jgi:hypothetical protein